MAIRYKAYTEEGRPVSGTLQVETEGEAEQVLWDSELVVVSLRRHRPRRGRVQAILRSQLPTLLRPKTRDVVSFTRELASLVESGIPLHGALELLGERISNPLLREAVGTVGREIAAGGSFSSAVGRQPQVFPSLYGRLLTVAEETGTMPAALRQVADYLEQQDELRQRTMKAVRYPAFVGLIGIVAAAFLVGYSLPAMTDLLRQFGGELPLASRILIGFSDAARQFGPWAFLGLVAATGAGLAYSRTAGGAARKDAVLLGIPLVGRIALLSGMYRVTNSLETMLAAGLPLVESLRLTAGVAGNRRLERAVLSARDRVVNGEPFSRAIGADPVFPALMVQMARAGEEAGVLVRNLGTVSGVFRRDTERTVANLTGMLEPGMVLVVGAGVGFVAVAVLSAVYGTLGQVG